MMKPGVASYDKFKEIRPLLARSRQGTVLIPYFIAAHPGTTDEDMLALAQWLKHNGSAWTRCRPSCRHARTPTAMYHTNKNPLRKWRLGTSQNHPRWTPTPPDKAFLRYYDAENWPLLREALIRMGRTDLIATANATRPHSRPSERVPACATSRCAGRAPLARPPVYRKLRGKAKRVRGARGFDADRGNFQPRAIVVKQPSRKESGGRSGRIWKRPQCLTTRSATIRARPAATADFNHLLEERALHRRRAESVTTSATWRPPKPA